MNLKNKFTLVILTIIVLFGFASILIVRHTLTTTFIHEYSEYGFTTTSNIAMQSVDLIMTEKFYDLQQLIKRTNENNPDISYIFIISPEGDILAHTFEGGFPLELLKTSNIERNNAENLLVLSTENGFVSDFEYPVLDGKLGKVRLGLSQNHILEDVNEAILEVITFILILIFIGLIMAYILADYIQKPLKNLTNSVIEYGEGNLDVEIDTGSGDEVGELAHAFKKMIRELTKSHDSLREYNRQLEEKVSERTEDLNKKMTDLERTKMAILNMTEDLEQEHAKTLESEQKLKDTVKSLKKAESEMITLNQKLTHTNNELINSGKMRIEFMSVASHELKTPITSIMGFSELLQKDSIINDIEQRNKFLSIIVEESKHMSSLISDILDMSRIDAGTMKFIIEKIDLNEIAREAKGDMSIITVKKDISLRTNLENIPGIECDRKRIKQVIINLVNNAYKFTPAGGTITMHTYRKGNHVSLDIKDTGKGIPKEFLKRIFERFFQIDGSATRDAGGVGLGLAITKGIVEAHGGKITVKSTVGRGTTFSILLPLKLKKSPEKEFEHAFKSKRKQSASY